jgi:hypothetical protein
MPAGKNPALPHREGDRVIAEMYCDDCRASYRGAPFNEQPSFNPLEVIGPALRTRIEKRHKCARYRIVRDRFAALVTIANRAGEPEIRFIIVPSMCQGNDLVNFQRCKYEMLRAAAIAATIPEAARTRRRSGAGIVRRGTNVD